MSNQLSLKQLRAFNAVIITGSLSAASKLLNLTLPSVSKQLTALEDDLGIKLFVRQRGRIMTPTKQGLELFHHIESTIAELNDIPKIATEIAERGRRNIRCIATAQLISSEPLIRAVSAFRKLHSDVRLSLELRSRMEIEQWEDMRNVEFALAMLPTRNPILSAQSLVTTSVVAVLPRDHPLAEREVIRPEDVQGESLLLQGRRLLRARFDTVMRSHGFELQPTLEASPPFTCCRLAAAGLGIALTDPFSPTAADPASIVVRPWEPEIHLEYGLLEPLHHSPSETVNDLKRLISQEMAKFSTQGA